MSDAAVLWVLVGCLALVLVATSLRLALMILEGRAGMAVLSTLSIFGTLVLLDHVINMARRAA